MLPLELYRISDPAGIQHFPNPAPAKIPPELDSFAGFEKSFSQTLYNLEL